MAPTVAITEIDRPAVDVFEYATDPSRFGEWQKGVVDGSLDNPTAPKVGDLCRTSRRIGFAVRPSTSEITSIDPPRTWSIRGLDGPIRAIVDVTVEPLAEHRSRLTIAVDFEGHGIGRPSCPSSSAAKLSRRCPQTSLL
ncbi:hypothetical protein BH10ACT1_BH10ACT1_11790 [soil metagenome]